MNAEQITGATTVVLLIMIASTVITDVREHRISNVMVLAVLFLGLVSQLAIHDADGIVFWLGGLAIGLGLFLPFYIGGGMGAGDVKMMAAIGGCLGPMSALVATGSALVAGAPLVLIYIGLRHLHLIADDLQAASLYTHAHTGGKPKRRLKLTYQEGKQQRVPYAAAIAAGAVAGLWWSGNLEQLAGAFMA